MSRRSGATAFGKVMGAIWWLLVCGFFLSAGSAFGWLGRSKLLGFGGLRVVVPPPPQEAFHQDVQTFLILGCDEEYSQGSYTNRFYGGETGAYRSPDSSQVAKKAARSDMMMVVRMDFRNKQITGVSIPRDTWCQLPGQKVHKINAYYSIARPGQGAELAKQAVEYLIGVPIDKVIVINFDSMQKFVDLIGGVNVTVPRKMDYDDNAGMLHIHLKPGYQKLNGYQAMGYVRFRHSQHAKAYETDFQRQQREKDMLLGLKSSALSNWTRLPEIVDAGRAVLGDALSDDQVMSLAGFGRSVGPQNIKIGVIPTREKGIGLELVADKLPKVLEEYKLGDNSARVSLR